MNTASQEHSHTKMSDADQIGINDFAEWLARRWSQEKLSHSYIERRSARSKRKPASLTWSIDYISEAREKYVWNGKAFEQNAIETQKLGGDLLKALDTKDHASALSASLEILKWGNVHRSTKAGERPSVKWLRLAASKKELCDKIATGVTSLREGKVDQFDGENLTMDSGMTKVLSFADPEGKLIIYDGRVGAALGYLARLYLNEKNFNYVPESLRFRWGRAQTSGVNRNPSTVTFKFPGLWSGASKHKYHAQMMATASALIDKICQMQNSAASSRDWEAALFMIGYEVPGPKGET